MTSIDISFSTSDGVVLRGWLYTPITSSYSGKLPCLVMCHGFSAVKEMDLDFFAEHFVSHLPIACLVFDHRGFGDSDQASHLPRGEIIPALQNADISDAITYAQSRKEIDPDKIAIWGSSYSGGHVLYVGAVDSRVKAVLSQVPCVDGYTNFKRLVRQDFAQSLNELFQKDRLHRATGGDPAMIPVVHQDVHASSALPTPDSFDFFTQWGKKCAWKNEVTLRSVEYFRSYDPSAFIHRISPVPLLMTVAENDVLTPTDLALEAFSRALEPKELQILPGGHFDGYSGPNFEANAATQVKFLEKYLLK